MRPPTLEPCPAAPRAELTGLFRSRAEATGTSDAIKAMGVLREMKASLDQACSRREGAFELRSEPRLTRFRCAQNKG